MRLQYIYDNWTQSSAHIEIGVAQGTVLKCAISLGSYCLHIAKQCTLSVVALL